VSETSIETPGRFRSELRQTLVEVASAASAPASVTGATPARSVVPRLRLARWLAPGLALAAVLAAAMFGFGSGGGVVAPPAASAASVLYASANALERHPASFALTPGDYFYTRFDQLWREVSWGHKHSFTVHSTDEIWTARDGGGRVSERVLHVNGPASAKRSIWARSSDTRLRPSRNPYLLGFGGLGVNLSYTQLRDLPTDSAGLARFIDRTAAHAVRTSPEAHGANLKQLRSALIFEMVRSLAEEPATAAVRATLYRLLAKTPGIRLLGRRTDAIGRTGMAVMAKNWLFRFTMILDPATGALLEYSRALVHRSPLMPGYPAGIINRSTFLQTGVVRSTHSTP
jgi:hypothetical protein